MRRESVGGRREVGHHAALLLSRMLHTHRLFRKRSMSSAASLLFHNFFPEGENKKDGIDRLRRELDWICANYIPISLPQFVASLATATLQDRAVLVTSDDAS